jgi:serine phosphatase RsbU (regulator of sigma subunit)/anti-anti-sigma regulatory factor
MTDKDKPVFLVVDDDPIVRRLVTRGLEALDPASIREASDGVEAQDILREGGIDIVITDVLMPNMDGRELMNWAQEHCPGPLWIVLSGLDTFDAAVDALHLGAYDFIAKPPSLPQLRVSVRNAMDQLELTRDRQRLYGELAASHDQLAEKVQQLETVCRLLEDQARVIQSDLQRAETIQRALLPQVPPSIQGWCIETLYRPGSNVGGDYYDIIPLNDHSLGIVVADAAGHGVAAAMLAVLFKHRLQLLDDDGVTPLRPADVLARVNRKLLEDMTGPGMFITAVYALLDTDSGELRLASAGHPPPIRVNELDEPRFFRRTGPALGLEQDSSYSEENISLAQLDRIFLYTDGVLEGGSDSPTLDDIAQKLAENDGDRAALLKDFYRSAIRGVDQDRDDITMVLLQRCTGESHFDSMTTEEQKSEDTQPPPPQVQFRQGAAGRLGFISISGKGTWTDSVAFFEAATHLLEERDGLVVDLEGCEYLDSTFLGTLHEIAASAPGRVALQGVPGSVRASFEELDMNAVIEVISADARALPESMKPMRHAQQDDTDQSFRVLKAHEILASLSDTNQEQFRGVVEALRDDLRLNSEETGT